MSEISGNGLTDRMEDTLVRATGAAVGRTEGPGLSTAAEPLPRSLGDTVREAYSFVCLNCAYGWEQGYEIEHHTDRTGHTVVQYLANGVRVPSPLQQPSCPGCGGHTVRIMGAGRVATVELSWHRPKPAAAAGKPPAAAPADQAADRPARRRLHLPFHRWLRGRHGTPEA